MGISLVSATYYPTSEQINISISCENINCSDGDIYMTVIDQTGQQVIDNQNTTKSNGFLFYQTNLSSDGDHSIFLASDNDYYSTTFTTTEGGVEFTEGRAVLINGLLLLLVAFVFLSLFAMFMIENYIGKFTLYWISHILLILTTFVAWQIGVDGLFSGLAITGIFRIMFWVLLIGVVPMVFLSVAWVVYIHLFNEHFQKLIDKGVSTEEAFAIANKKRGGWFNGQ